jgi:DMSO reductase anchor subunit
MIKNLSTATFFHVTNRVDWHSVFGTLKYLIISLMIGFIRLKSLQYWASQSDEAAGLNSSLPGL